MNRWRTELLVAVALLGWLAAPAQAGHNPAACPEGAACVWDQTDFRGDRTEVPSSGCLDSRIRSALNGSDEPLSFYMSGGCAGPVAATLAPGQAEPRISAGSAARGCSPTPVDSCGGETPAPAP